MPPAPMPTLTCWPAVPSKTINAILPAVLIVALTVAPPITARPVNATLAAVFGAGGTKKSSALCVAPPDPRSGEQYCSATLDPGDDPAGASHRDIAHRRARTRRRW